MLSTISNCLVFFYDFRPQNVFIKRTPHVAETPVPPHFGVVLEHMTPAPKSATNPHLQIPPE